MELPRIIQQENDPAVLRAYMKFIIDENSQLQKRVFDLEAEKNKSDQQLLNLDDKLLVFKKRMFGRSSEKRVSDRERGKLKKQLTLHGQSLAPAPIEDEGKKLPEIEVHHELSSEDLANIAEQYGYARESEWEHLTGLYDESSEVDVVVQSYVRKKHKRHKYRLKATKGADQEVIVSAPSPLKLIPGGSYSVEFATEVVAGKYLYHLPLERIVRQMESAGLKVLPKTLYNLCFFIACYLEDVAKRILEEILSCGLALHIDETTWPINNKKQSDGYMWVVSNQGGSFYQFEPTRSGKIAKELVGSYAGPVVTDGYQGYRSQFKNMEQIDLAFCWAHVRRKFTDIQKNYPQECEEILEVLEALFAVEREAKDFTELKILRREKSKLIIDEIRSWLFAMKVEARSESHLEKAINYTLNHWDGLIKFLNNERIPLTNNDVERTIRHSVMGRKNFHGSRTINGADVAATLYTIIESCKKVELDPKTYILMAVKKKIQGEQPPTPLQYALQIRKNEVKTA